MGLIGEALLGTTGILRALEPGPVRVTRSQLAQADRLPAEVRERLDAFLEAEDFRKVGEPRTLNYERMLELLTEPITEARLRENVDGWAEQVLADEYADALGRAWAYLQGKIPIKRREHLTGDENVRPSDLELARFRRVFEVVEDPLSVLERVAEGALLPDEVTVLQEVYPAITELLRGKKGAPGLVGDALADEVVRRRKTDKNWHIPRRKEVMLRRLLNQPKGALEGAVASQIRQDYDRARQQSEQQQERPAPSGKPPETDKELTRIQRIELTK